MPDESWRRSTPKWNDVYLVIRCACRVKGMDVSPKLMRLENKKGCLIFRDDVKYCVWAMSHSIVVN